VTRVVAEGVVAAVTTVFDAPAAEVEAAPSEAAANMVEEAPESLKLGVTVTVLEANTIMTDTAETGLDVDVDDAWFAFTSEMTIVSDPSVTVATSPLLAVKITNGTNPSVVLISNAI
jgi:hypothetical protein